MGTCVLSRKAYLGMQTREAPGASRGPSHGPLVPTVGTLRLAYPDPYNTDTLVRCCGRPSCSPKLVLTPEEMLTFIPSREAWGRGTENRGLVPFEECPEQADRLEEPACIHTATTETY